MTRGRRDGSEVPISGEMYVVGIGDAPAGPTLGDEVAREMSSMREEFIRRWHEPLTTVLEGHKVDKTAIDDLLRQ